jgi:hypothetical protein
MLRVVFALAPSGGQMKCRKGVGTTVEKIHM